MKTLLLLTLFCVSGVAQAQWEAAYAQELLATDSATSDTIFLLRQDGSIFGKMAAKTLVIQDHRYIFVVWNDSALVGSRQAHDDAIVRARSKQIEHIEQSPLNVWQKEAVKELLTDSSRSR